MEIDIKKITDSTSMDGEKVWICDYRQPDLNKKPLRHVRPCEVLVQSNDKLPENERVYYSETHFVKLGAKGQITKTIIGPFDTTGYRSATGTPLKVFTDEASCNAAYNEMADVIIDALDKKIASATELLIQEKMTVIKNKR